MILRSVPQGSCSLWIICILIINIEDLPDSVPVLGFSQMSCQSQELHLNVALPTESKHLNTPRN